MTMDDKKSQKIAKKYFCEKCNYVTCNKSDYNKHLLTAKHRMDDVWMTKVAEKSQYVCSCGKSYKYRQGLHKHQQRCNQENKLTIDYKDMFLNMVKQNKDLMNQVTDLIPKVGNNNNNTITNRNKFNINIFLNEECKDAITMNEFIKKIEVSLGNLLITQNKGLTEGVSNIFIENMNKLSLHERPMHCTDIKREIVYIKSDDNSDKGSSWMKDSENKKLKEALQKVSAVQQRNLKKWTQENPNWEQDPILQKEYMRLVKNSTDDLKENKREDKVIKKVCTNLYLPELE